jgi:hypothetical protein
MSNYENIKRAYLSMAGRENVIVTPIPYIEFMDGSHTAGALLNQIIFWSDKNQSGWFYKSYKDWFKETHAPERTIRRITVKMKKMGFLETKIKKANGNPTVHYRFLFDKFIEQFAAFLESTYPENPNGQNDASVSAKNDETLRPKNPEAFGHFNPNESAKNTDSLTDNTYTDNTSDNTSVYLKDNNISSHSKSPKSTTKICTICQTPLTPLNGKYLICQKCQYLYSKSGDALPNHYQPSSPYWQFGDSLAKQFESAMADQNYIVFSRIKKQNEAFHEDWRRHFIDILRLDMPDSFKTSYQDQAIPRFAQATKEVIEFIHKTKPFYIQNVIQSPAKFRENKRGTEVPWLYQLRSEYLNHKNNRRAKDTLFDDND